MVKVSLVITFREVGTMVKGKFNYSSTISSYCLIKEQVAGSGDGVGGCAKGCRHSEFRKKEAPGQHNLWGLI